MTLKKKISAGSVWRCEAGVVMIILALCFPLVLGLTGLGLEAGLWYVTKRQLQTAADAAVVAVTYETTAANRALAARNAVTANGFPLSSNVNIQINSPPTSGPY